MKIAMMTNNYKPFVAGVPISVERLSKGLRAQGHKVVIFAPSYDGQEEEADVVRCKSYVKNVANGFSVPNAMDSVIEQRFAEEAFDVIHVHHPMLMGDMARHLSKKYDVPLIFTYHTRYEQYLHYIGLTMLRKIMPEYIRFCTRQCELVLAPSPGMKKYLENIRVEAPVAVLPTGLLPEEFQPDLEKSAMLRQKFPGTRYLFCCVARLAKEKNIEFLLQSMRLRKDACGSDFKLILIGDGPEREHLEKQAELLGIKEEIVFEGRVPKQEVKNYCHACDLFLFASQSETQGIGLIESMAVGTPVLAVRGSGTEDVVINGENGYMTEASEKKFAQKLMDILEKGEVEILTQGALQTAKEYDSNRIAARAVGLYQEAVRERQQSRWRTGLPAEQFLCKV